MQQRFSELELCVIVNTTTGKWLEGHFNRSRAEKALDIVNTHEIQNRRPAVYVIQEKTKEEVQAYNKNNRSK